MKKLLFSTALLLSFCCLTAQTKLSKSEKQSPAEEISYLQKSDALMKIQLKDQKQTLLKQIQKTDSMTLLLQSLISELKKGEENYNSMTQSINKLNNQTASIGHSLSKRKHYAVIAIVGSIMIVLAYLFFMNSKLVAINKNIQQNEEDLNRQLADAKEIINKISKEFNADIDEINEKLKKRDLSKF